MRNEKMLKFYNTLEDYLFDYYTEQSIWVHIAKIITVGFLFVTTVLSLLFITCTLVFLLTFTSFRILIVLIVFYALCYTLYQVALMVNDND